MRTRSIALATSVLAIASVLAGCTGQAPTDGMPGMNHSTPSSGSSPAADAGHNSADVMFAQSMIPHHQQAVEMADMVLKKDGIDDRVRTLAQNIKAAQGPEITTMTGWLKKWGASTPDPMLGMSGMDHGDGMMSADDMAKLDAATGADAGKLFLEQMIQHHQGAITMAQAETGSGKNTAAVALAKKIVSAQTEEISEMQTLLSNL